MLGDPSLRYLRARVLEADANIKGAEALVDDPKQWITSYGPCWAVRGRLARERGDQAAADSSFSEAIAHDPFGIEAACQTPVAGPSGTAGTNVQGSPLCDAARSRAEPDVGHD